MDAEKENTFRALREEPLLMTHFLCRFGWHRWQKWSAPTRDGFYIVQDRICDSCGKWKRRKKLPS